MHLFVSFIMRATMSYLKDLLFYKGIALYSDIEYANGEIVAVNPHCVSPLMRSCRSSIKESFSPD